MVFDSIQLCETCRLGVVDRMRAWGFLLSQSHIFLDEFSTVKDSEIKL